MPIKPIAYSTFTAKTTFSHNWQQGILEGSENHWDCELMNDEGAARAKLLASELCRFISMSPQPIARISSDNEAFFLLTEVTNYDIKQYTEKKLVSKWLNIMVSNQDSVCSIIHFHAEAIKNYPQLKDHLNSVLLNIILIPRAALIYFVDACTADSSQKNMLHGISDRQEMLVKELMRTFGFKVFLRNTATEKYISTRLEALKTFRIHGEKRLMRSFTLECIDALQADQWKDIHINSNEFYMMPLKPQARRVSPQLLLEGEPLVDAAIPNPSTPAELLIPKGSSAAESPASVMFRQTPILEEPLTLKPAPIPHSSLIRNFSGLFIQNLMKGLRGSPLAVVPMAVNPD